MKQVSYCEKALKLTYEDYLQRGETIENINIEQYLVYNQIGKGSNGHVYRGMDDRTKNQVAIKLMDLRKINAEDKIVVKLIKQRLSESEPKLMYQCNSPNLVKCYDVFRNEDLKVLVLEYCNGGTLQAEIQEKGRIGEREAVEITKHIIKGLMELHHHKIIHRDLKAENIMSHNGTYKIIDFGFSKKLQIAQENAQIKGTALGTITTMAPEVMSKRHYGLKADIWSLGVIFFQMIYGTYPYDSSNAENLYKEIKNKRLFKQVEPLMISNYRPSKQAYDFIRFLIVFDTQERPSWKEVSEHPLIQRDCAQIKERFINNSEMPDNEGFSETQFKDQKIENSQKQVQRGNQDVEQDAINKKLMLKGQMEIRKSIEQLWTRQSEKLSQNQTQSEEKKIKYLDRTMMIIKKRKDKDLGDKGQELQQEQVMKKRREEVLQEKEQQKFIERAHFECLKTQFIFRQIVNPLLSTQYLPLHDRNTIQFLYLLLARCFNNMSPIQFQLEKGRLGGKQMINNLNEQITLIYNQVKQKFIHFGKELTIKEDKWYNVMGDFIERKVRKQDFKEKDKFFTGIEVINYVKSDQISFTYKYYNSKIKKKIEGINNLSKVKKRLDKYVQINQISNQSVSISKKTFGEYVRQITT